MDFLGAVIFGSLLKVQGWVRWNDFSEFVLWFV